jgi:nucleotidyltransferase/DNA polymerase involved in DNA repair
MSNILTSSKFKIPEEQMARLREAGARISTVKALDEVKLNLPGPGEQVVGSLTEEEMVLFLQACEAIDKMEEAHRQLVSRQLAAMSHAALTSAQMAEMHNVKPSPEDQAIIDEYCEWRHLQEYLRTTLWWMVGSRLNIHDHHLGVRKGGKIVKLTRRY